MNTFRISFLATIAALWLTACSDELAGQAKQAAN